MKTGELNYKVTYTYVDPGPAGPFKGSMTVQMKYARGEAIRAPFGLATVRSCRLIKGEDVKTVKISELSKLRMVAGNEKRYDTVVHNGRVKDWVGIGWIDIGPADAESRAKYPVVKD